MEPIVIFTRAKVCDKPLLKKTKTGASFYVFTIETSDTKYPCRCFEDAECFPKIEQMHLQNGDYLDLNCTMKKMVKVIKVACVTEDGENAEANVSHEVTYFKVKGMDFAIPYEIKKKSEQSDKNEEKSIDPLTDLSGFEDWKEEKWYF